MGRREYKQSGLQKYTRSSDHTLKINRKLESQKRYASPPVLHLRVATSRADVAPTHAYGRRKKAAMVAGVRAGRPE
jgi:hypothetical protein